MRISGGRAKGITLRVPAGMRVRPATDGMRQALFSSLGARVVGARVLDLFSGSGAYGLEALSRGAASGAWVERHAGTLRCLRDNLAAVCRSCGCATEGWRIVEGDATRVPWPANESAPDLVFVDPPYEMMESVAPEVRTRLGVLLAGNPNALVAWESPGEFDPVTPGWECVKRLGKGRHQPSVTVLRLVAGLPAPN